MIFVSGLHTLSPTKFSDVWFWYIEIGAFVAAVSFAMIDRQTSFYSRALVHLTATGYAFFSLLWIRAFLPFFSGAGLELTRWATLVIVFLMLAQYFITCPRCKAAYGLIFYDATKAEVTMWGNRFWGVLYAPWVKRVCVKCGRDRTLPHDAERN